MPVFYHVTTAADWEAAKQKGEYIHPSLEAEGFIPVSYTHLDVYKRQIPDIPMMIKQHWILFKNWE